MKELAHRALNQAQLLGASYADIRIVLRRFETISVHDGHVSGLSNDESNGFGIRVLFDGAWGFASSSRIEPAEIDRIAALAVEIAKASRSSNRGRIELGPPIAHVGSYRTPILVNPFEIPIERKLDILMQADERMRSVPGISITDSSLGAQREWKLFASTEGSLIEQELFETGCGIEATAVGHGDVQKRSYPNSFGRHQAKMGFELVEEMDLPGNAVRIAEEAVQLLTAPVCPSGKTTVILDGPQMAIQIHESIGHALELDRIFGMEASYAGTSFVHPGMLHTFQYGSPIVEVTADATAQGGLGTFGFDDEGVPAQKVPLIRKGRLENVLSSRETAAQLGLSSNGTMLADGWNRIPLIRMTNINLEPGEWTLDGLIHDTEDGLLLATNKSWSIDDKRLNFQFATEVAWEIKGGKKGRMFKNPTYTGITPQFWAGCDGICDRDHWRIWGIPNCGKGQPPQTAHVGHGAAPARFRNVEVGVIG
ncbi:MAG: TldD/PmbA family protein [Bacteroidota bacterium]